MGLGTLLIALQVMEKNNRSLSHHCDNHNESIVAHTVPFCNLQRSRHHSFQRQLETDYDYHFLLYALRHGAYAKHYSIYYPARCLHLCTRPH